MLLCISLFLGAVFGPINDAVGFIAAVTMLIWLTLMVIGIIGPVSPKASKQSVSQISSMGGRS